MRVTMRTAAGICACLVLAGVSTRLLAEDWPEFRGAGRLGIWHETGLLESFPADGLRVRWRSPIRAGLAGPAVADGRVFATDWEPTDGMRGVERALAFDEVSGQLLWSTAWEADYAGVMWEIGPGATPTVDGERVYMLGRTGTLSALDVETGALLWRKDYGADYGVDRMQWGFDWASPAPRWWTATSSSAWSADPRTRAWWRSTSTVAKKSGGHCRARPISAWRNRSSSRRAACASSSCGIRKRSCRSTRPRAKSTGASPTS